MTQMTHAEQEAKVSEWKEQLKTAKEDLKNLESWVTPDSVYLKNFTDDISRRLVIDHLRLQVKTVADVFRELVSRHVSREDYEKWILYQAEEDNEVTMEFQFEREETTQEYQVRLKRERSQFLEKAKKADPAYQQLTHKLRVLWHTVKTLEKKVNNLTNRCMKSVSSL
jgi:hypothetical protein